MATATLRAPSFGAPSSSALGVLSFLEEDNDDVKVYCISGLLNSIS